MAKVLLVETKPSKNNFSDLKFEYDRVALTSDSSLKKVLKKDVEIDVSIADDYDWVILVGSEPFKLFTKKSSVMEYCGKVVDEKFIPTINPGMLAFKPEMKPLWQEAVTSINGYVSGQRVTRKYDASNFQGISDKESAIKYIEEVRAKPYSYIGLDSETSALYPRDGIVLGISLCGAPNTGAYIDANIIDEEVIYLLQKLFFEKNVVFHNAKFDIAMLSYHFGFEFPNFEDTMLLSYTIDERPGNHGLKTLALKHTEYGDYEEDLYTYITEYCKAHGVLKSAFTWDLIPFDVMYPYAAIDSCVTFLLYDKLSRAVQANDKLFKLYKTILIPAVKFLLKVQDNGVPFDKDRLLLAKNIMDMGIEEAIKELYSYPEVMAYEAEEGEFNPNSVQQLRKLLFDYVKLTPTGLKTTTGADSTNAEALEMLSAGHAIPGLILTIRKDGKIRNTYLDKIIPELDWDGRLRTNFNIHSTTSGRLSSSGKLNMQQLPRDNPAVKGCIMAKPGYKIVSMDLKTAEVYIAAVLSGDKNLQDVFKSGGDFHSTMAKKVFNLPCAVEDVKELFPEKRQATKAVTFGILYGAKANKISAQVTKDSGTYFSKAEAQQVIDEYFRTFKQLKKWLDNAEAEILRNGFVYSYFGRKRRLRNVKSSDNSLIAHEVRSGINFLIQSPSSDINLLAGIAMQEYIERENLDAKIFALVHDSILAEVREDIVDEYKELLQEFVAKAAPGLMIPGCPIGTDFEIGEDYSFGKFEKTYLSSGDNIQHELDKVPTL